MRTFFAVLIATWFGSGFIPRIPKVTTRGFAGTWGSLAALPLCICTLWLCHQLPLLDGWMLYASIVGSVMLLGAWSLEPAMAWLSGWLVRHRQRDRKMFHDQYEVVIDEVFGMLISCAPLYFLPDVPLWLGLGLSFLCFRIFDGTKPWPVRYFDQQKSPLSIIWDDGVAGLMAAAVVTIILQVFF
ncbi:MAG: phosphatidylglycerophosphatase A [Patescibacteria group bacterium]|jgi:phosphatidylglycerophosphatase A